MLSKEEKLRAKQAMKAVKDGTYVPPVKSEPEKKKPLFDFGKQKPKENKPVQTQSIPKPNNIKPQSKPIAKPQVAQKPYIGDSQGETYSNKSMQELMIAKHKAINNPNIPHDQKVKLINSYNNQIAYREKNPLKEEVFGKSEYSKTHQQNQERKAAILSNKNLSKEQKVAGVKGLSGQNKENLNEDIKNDVRFEAYKKLQKKQDFSNEHPYLAMGRAMVDPTDMAENMLLEDMLKNGELSDNGFAKTSLGTKAKMAGAGAATGASDALLLAPAFKAAAAPITAMATADAAKASQALKAAEALIGTEEAANVGNIANLIGNANRTARAVKFAKAADAINHGMAFGALGTIPSYLHGDASGWDIMQNAGRLGVAGGFAGALSPYVSKGVNSLSNVGNLAKPIEDTALNRLSSGLIDWGTFLGADYGLGKLNGEDTTIGEKAAEFAPFLAFPFAHAATKPMPMPKLNYNQKTNWGANAMANAANIMGDILPEGTRARQFQDVKNAVMHYATPQDKQFNTGENYLLEQADALSPTAQAMFKERFFNPQDLLAGKLQSDNISNGLASTVDIPYVDKTKLNKKFKVNQPIRTQTEKERLAEEYPDLFGDAPIPGEAPANDANVNAEMDASTLRDFDTAAKNNQKVREEKDKSIKETNEINLRMQKERQEAEEQAYFDQQKNNKGINETKEKAAAEARNNVDTSALLGEKEVNFDNIEPTKFVDHKPEGDLFDALSQIDFDIDNAEYDRLVRRNKKPLPDNEGGYVGREVTVTPEGEKEPDLFDVQPPKYKEVSSMSKYQQQKLAQYKKKYYADYDRETNSYIIRYKNGKKRGEAISYAEYKAMRKKLGAIGKNKYSDIAKQDMEGNISDDAIKNAEKQSKEIEDTTEFNEARAKENYEDTVGKEKAENESYTSEETADEIYDEHKSANDFYEGTNTVNEEINPSEEAKNSTKYRNQKVARFLEDWRALENDTDRVDAIKNWVKKIKRDLSANESTVTAQGLGVVKKKFKEVTNNPTKLSTLFKRPEKTTNAVKEFVKGFVEEATRVADREKAIAERKGETYNETSLDRAAEYVASAIGDIKLPKDIKNEFKVPHSGRERNLAHQKWQQFIGKKYNLKDQLNSGSKETSQTRYNELAKEVLENENISPSQKQLMLEQLNKAANTIKSERGYDIETEHYDAQNTFSEVINEIQKNIKEENFDANRKLIRDSGIKWLNAENPLYRKAREAIKSHYNAVVDKLKPEMDGLIAEGKIKEAKEIWDREKNVFATDIRLGTGGKEQKAFVEKDNSGKKFSNDTKWTKEGTGQTWNSDLEQDITAAERAVNQFYEKYENIFEKQDKVITNESINRMFGSKDNYTGKYEMTFDFGKNIGSFNSLLKKFVSNYNTAKNTKVSASKFNAFGQMQAKYEELGKALHEAMQKHGNKNINFIGPEETITDKRYRKIDLLPEKPYIGIDEKGNIWIDPRTQLDDYLVPALKKLDELSNGDGTFKKTSYLVGDKPIPKKETSKAKEVGSFDKIDRGDVITKFNIRPLLNEIYSKTKHVADFMRKFLPEDTVVSFKNEGDDKGLSLKNRNEIIVDNRYSIEDNKVTAKHELLHQAQKLVAKAIEWKYGKGSKEAEALRKSEEINRKGQDLRAKYPSIHEDFKYVRKHIGDVNDTKVDYIKNEKYVNERGINLFEDYVDYASDYRMDNVENEAFATEKDEYKLFGKDITEYEGLLEEYAKEQLRLKAGGSGRELQGNGSEGNISGQISRLDADSVGSSTGEDRTVGLSMVSTGDSGTRQRLKPSELFKKYNQDTSYIDHMSEISTMKDAYTYRAISKDTEAMKLDLKLITEEQSEARKKMLKSDVYAPQHHNPTKEELKANKKSFNPFKRNKKNTLYGESKHGQKQSVTGRDIAINVLKDHVKTKAIYDIVKSVKELAKPWKSGMEKEGYVGVNFELLANVLARGGSREMYETIAKGPEAIAMAFRNENKDFNSAIIDLHNRTKKQTHGIPKNLYNELFSGHSEHIDEFIDRYCTELVKDKGKKKITLKGRMKQLGYAYDTKINLFKRGVLATPKFNVNNRVSNWMLLAANSDNPLQFISSLVKAGKLKNSDVPAKLLDNSIYSEMVGYNKEKARLATGGINDFIALFNGEHIDTSNLKKIIEVNKDGKTELIKNPSAKPVKDALLTTGDKVIGLPNRAYANIAEKMMKFNSKFEDFERKVAYVQAMDKNRKAILKGTGQQIIGLQDALKYVRSHPELESSLIRDVENCLGNYRDFSPMEKKLIKRVVPFYSWFRTVARESYHLCKEKPTRAALIAYEMYKIIEEDDELKDYQKGSIRTMFKDPRSGFKLLINFTRQVPWSTMREFGGEGFLGNFAPDLNTLYGVTTGRKTFMNSPISSKRYATNDWGKTYYDANTGKKLDKLPLSAKLNYGAKETLKSMYPFLNNNSLKGLPEGLISLGTKGKWETPDVYYDDTFGGYRAGEPRGHLTSAMTRIQYPQSEEVKALNKYLGLPVQLQKNLNKKEAKDAKIKRQQKKMKEKHKS